MASQIFAGSGNDKTAAGTLTFAPRNGDTSGATLAQGDVIGIALIFDPATASTPTITSVTGGTNITWTVVGDSDSDSGAANTGVRAALIIGVAGASPVLSTSTTITVTFSTGSPTAKVWVTHGWRGLDASGPVIAGSFATARGNGTAASITTGASLAAGDIAFGVVGWEGLQGTNTDTDTTRGSWGTDTAATTSGGVTASNVRARGQSKVTSGGAGTQTYDLTIGATSHWSGFVVGLAQTPAAADATLTTSTGTATASGGVSTFAGTGPVGPIDIAALALTAATPPVVNLSIDIAALTLTATAQSNFFWRDGGAWKRVQFAARRDGAWQYSMGPI